jgi:hypothetical protein
MRGLYSLDILDSKKGAFPEVKQIRMTKGLVLMTILEQKSAV